MYATLGLPWDKPRLVLTNSIENWLVWPGSVCSSRKRAKSSVIFNFGLIPVVVEQFLMSSQLMLLDTIWIFIYVVSMQAAFVSFFISSHELARWREPSTDSYFYHLLPCHAFSQKSYCVNKIFRQKFIQVILVLKVETGEANFWPPFQ